MTLAEKILLLLSREPKGSDNKEEKENIDNTLSSLCSVFPGFIGMIQEKSVVDFDSGAPYQSTALAKSGAKAVLWLDENLTYLKESEKTATLFHVQEKVSFANSIAENHKGRFDIVISNGMEHFPDPADILVQMRSLLKPDGLLLVNFGPPWLAPYGSHMQFFTKVPWVNVLFSEKTVMGVRSRFRNDGATRYQDAKFGIQKLTVAKFEQILSVSGLDILYQKYQYVKGMRILGKVPVIREFFINHLSYILKVASS